MVSLAVRMNFLSGENSCEKARNNLVAGENSTIIDSFFSVTS